MVQPGGNQGFDPVRLQRIGDVITRNYVEKGAIPGALTLIWRGGELVWQGMSGTLDLARRSPMREDAIFRIYSMTKPVTAVAILMLMEEGRIALDDPVSRYIPGFADLGIYAGGTLGGFLTTPNIKPMKVVDLLRHTSGLTYGFLNRTNLDAAYRKLHIAESEQRGRACRHDRAIWKSCRWNSRRARCGIIRWAWMWRAFWWKRSPAAASRISCAAASSPRWSMHDTDFQCSAARRERLSTCYYVREGKLAIFDDAANSAYAQPPQLESGGGGLAGTAADYLRFCRMLLNGGELDGVRLLSPKTVQLMTMNHLPGRTAP